MFQCSLPSSSPAENPYKIVIEDFRGCLEGVYPKRENIYGEAGHSADITERAGNMQDRRRFQRKDLVHPIKIFKMEDDSFFGYLKNITLEGFMVVSGNQKIVDETYKIKMSLPKTISGKDDLIINAKSVWSKKDIDSENFITGFQLVEVSPGEREVIKQLIDYFGLK